MCGVFFSSRRRHTRLQGDWSSDVCSSDLDPKGAKKVEQDWPSDGAVVGKTERLLDLTFVTQIDPEERRLLRHWLENVPNIDFNQPVLLALRSQNGRHRVYIDARGLWMPARLTSLKSVENVCRGEAA